MTGNIWSTQRSNSIFHVPMVAKFLDNKFLDTGISNFIDLLQYHLICQMLANLSGVVSESILSKFRTRNGKCLHCVVPENIHTLPVPPQRNSDGRWGGPKGGNFRGCGVLFRAFFFSGGLSKIGQLLINNSFSVK